MSSFSPNIIYPLLFLSSFIATWFLQRLLSRKNLFDIPNERSSHNSPVPKSGGVGFVITFLLGVIYFSVSGSVKTEYAIVLIAILPLALVGLLDDFNNLGVLPRLSSQVFSISIVLYILPLPTIPLFDANLILDWAVLPLVMVALVWCVNLYNFMDGIDSLAVSQAIFFCLSLLVLNHMFSFSGPTIILISLAACLLGFLTLNLPPAKIFMGDAGSNFLGLGLPAIALINSDITGMSPWVYLILMGAFIVDSSYTLVQRMLNGQVWYHAHRSHAYQKLTHLLLKRFDNRDGELLVVKSGGKSAEKSQIKHNMHGVTVLLVIALNVFWLFPLSWLAQSYVQMGFVFLLVAYVPLIIGVSYLKAGQ